MKQKIIALLLAGLSLFPIATPISAKMPDNGIVAPQWEYIDSIKVDIIFSDSTATVTVTRRNQTVTKLEGTLTVYKKVGSNWIYVASNSDTSARALSIDVDFDPISGVTYKAVAEITAYSANGSEPGTSSKIETCP